VIGKHVGRPGGRVGKCGAGRGVMGSRSVALAGSRPRLQMRSRRKTALQRVDGAESTPRLQMRSRWDAALLDLRLGTLLLHRGGDIPATRQAMTRTWPR